MKINVNVHTHAGTIKVVHNEAYSTIDTFLTTIPGGGGLSRHLYLAYRNANVLNNSYKQIPEKSAKCETLKMTLKVEKENLKERLLEIETGTQLWHIICKWTIGGGEITEKPTALTLYDQSPQNDGRSVSSET